VEYVTYNKKKKSSSDWSHLAVELSSETLLKKRLNKE
jgi:hypothetical protein